MKMRIQSVEALILTLIQPLTLIHAICDPNATSSSTTSSTNGCSYPACAPTDPLLGGTAEKWRCVHDHGFCSAFEFPVSASEVLSAGRVCGCQDILDYPSLIGVCDYGVTQGFTPMLVDGDCEGGTAVCESTTQNAKGSTYLVGDTDQEFTACDLQCDFNYGHVMLTPDDTYHGCQFPKFNWTTSTTSLRGTMSANQLQVLNDTLYVGGSLWTFDVLDNTTTPTVFDFRIQGPFTADDPTASSGTSISHMVQEYDEINPYECAIASIDKHTGVPLNVLSLVGPGACYINAMGRDTNGTVLVAAGDYANKGVLTADTSICTPVETGEGGSRTECSDDNHTTIYAHDAAHTGHVFYMDADGHIRWLVQPWLNLRADLADQNLGWYQMSVTGIAVDDVGDVYVTGFRATQEEGAAYMTGIIYYAMLTKLSGEDGSVLWEKEFMGAQHTLNSAYDSTIDALFVTMEVLVGTDEIEGLGITCNSDADEVEGCNVLMRVNAANGEVNWVRYAYGVDNTSWNISEPWNRGDVQLAHPDDGPYVYASFSGVGTHGPTGLDFGTSYAGCLSTMFKLPEYHSFLEQFEGNLNEEACSQVGATYFNRTSDDAIPAAIANTDATCGGYGVVSCIVKYNKLTGLPVWGSAKPRIYGFKPQSDGIILVGSNYGPVTLDTTTVSGPIGAVEGYDMVFQSKLRVEDGKGVYVQPIIADRSWAAGAGLTEDPATNNIYLAFFTTTDLTYLGPGAPGGFVQDLQINTCGALDETCVGSKRMTVALLGEETSPICIATCDSSAGNHNITDGYCYIDQVCYQDGDSALRIGMPCMQCNPAKSQTKWSQSTALGVDFCLIDGLCHRYSDPYKMKVAGSYDILASECQMCSPTENIYGWSLREGYTFVEGQNAPDDCIKFTALPSTSPTLSPVVKPTKRPVRTPTEAPVKKPSDESISSDSDDKSSDDKSSDDKSSDDKSSDDKSSDSDDKSSDDVERLGSTSFKNTFMLTSGVVIGASMFLW